MQISAEPGPRRNSIYCVVNGTGIFRAEPLTGRVRMVFAASYRAVLTLSGDIWERLFRTFGAGDPRRAAAIPLRMAGIPGPPAELAPVRADTGLCGPKTQALQWLEAARQP